jgi:predicted Zn finger-like uncharacterized protein
MVTIPFYCGECEYSSDIKLSDISTDGFQVQCPHCERMWDFMGECYEPICIDEEDEQEVTESAS